MKDPEKPGNSEEYRLLTLAYVTLCITLFLGGDSDTAFLCCYMGNKVSDIPLQ